jgi:hypothetical protein
MESLRQPKAHELQMRESAVAAEGKSGALDLLDAGPLSAPLWLRMRRPRIEAEIIAAFAQLC